MTDIVWEDPPPVEWGPRNRPAYTAFAAELHAHPGKWALHPRSFASKSAAQCTANQIRKGQQKSFPVGFEATSREVGAEHRVYVRFVGEGAA